MTNEQVVIIEKLRSAAKEYGVVCDLLMCLDDGLLIDGNGNREIIADDEGIAFIEAAIVAARFAAYDRGEASDD